MRPGDNLSAALVACQSDVPCSRLDSRDNLPGMMGWEPVPAGEKSRWGNFVRDPWLFLLVALTAIALVPIWAFPYFPSQDGPSHLYNVFVLAHWNDTAFRFRDYYSLSLLPFPNWTATALLYALMQFLSPATAHKALLTLYVVLMAVCWRWWIAVTRQAAAGHDLTDHAATPLVLLGPLLSWSFFLMKGFYSFCFSLPFFLLAVGYAWKTRRETALAPTLLRNLLLIIVYLSHLVSFFLALLSCLLIYLLAPWELRYTGGKAEIGRAHV